MQAAAFPPSSSSLAASSGGKSHCSEGEVPPAAKRCSSLHRGVSGGCEERGGGRKAAGSVRLQLQSSARLLFSFLGGLLCFLHPPAFNRSENC